MCYIAIGQKGSAVAKVVTTFHTIVVAEMTNSLATLQYLRAALAEYFIIILIGP